MANSDRVQREQEQYDSHAVKRDTFNKNFAHANELLDQQILNDARGYLLDAGGKNVLEIGCQSWKGWVDDLGLRPRELHCINISKAELDAGSDLAEASAVKPEFHLMDAHGLEFDDEHFDLVFGAAILHHLDMEKALPEIRRVLKPGGLMVFAEPLDMNPAAKLIRLLTPRARTADEHAFRSKDLRMVADHFSCSTKFYQLFAVPVSCVSVRLFKDAANPVMRSACFVDRMLVRVIPPLKPYSRYALIVGRKK